MGCGGSKEIIESGNFQITSNEKETKTVSYPTSYMNEKKIDEENLEITSNVNELKIELYPENKPRNTFDRESLNNLITEKTIAYSFDINKKLGFINTNVPLLNGFYQAHINHYPIRIKPDDIWLLIVQAFSNHVNTNSEKLRNYFVNFDGKKTLNVTYKLPDISYINKTLFENFPEKINDQLIEYVGKEILENLTPNFTTTNINSRIICKLSIMGAFKKYFDYEMDCCVCGNSYIILEGTSEDYIKIKKKAEYLKKYEFGWYIDRIIPIIEKMIDAKDGKIDVDFFKNIIKEEEMETYESHGCISPPSKVIKNFINGWLLKFFAYYDSGKKFEKDSIKVKDFKDLANQLLIVPFKLIIRSSIFKKKEYDMKYKVGFIGCDQNAKKEVFPVQGWLVSPITEKERDSLL